MTQAVKDCIKEGILVEFLKEHSAEAINMLAQEFDINIAKQIWLEEGREEGREEGLEEGRLETAKAMLQEDFPIEVIARIAKLSREQIESLMSK